MNVITSSISFNHNPTTKESIPKINNCSACFIDYSQDVKQPNSLEVLQWKKAEI